jgi:hypothetical protein
MVDTDGPQLSQSSVCRLGLRRVLVYVLQVQQGSSKRIGGRNSRRKEALLRLQACERLDIESSPMQLWVCSAIFRFEAAGLPMTLEHSRQVDRMIPLRMVLRTKYGTLGCRFTGFPSRIIQIRATTS